jgi:Uma2 family endonuclease
MEAAEKPAWLTVEEYLAGEERSEVRHEYLGDAVYAMAGASIEHNIISGNIYSSLRAHLRGKPCGAFMAAVKVRLEFVSDDVFYYPDVMVACDPRDTDRFFKRFPRGLIEVMSESTERIDRREKRLSYQQIETLEEYVSWRRTGWKSPSFAARTSGGRSCSPSRTRACNWLPWISPCR